MFRARFLIWLVVGSGYGATLKPAAQAQTNRLFPSKAPAQSEALRNAPHRTPPPPRPDTVSLPYHLLWGDTQNRLAALFAGVGAKIASKKTEANNETWAVQGLIAPNLQGSLFTFQDGQLAALEFDYGQADWDLAKYDDMMGQFRRLLEAKCEKPGEMISRDSDQTAPNGVKQSLMGYQWSRGDTLVQLFYFSAEDPAKSLAFRSISVHYHYQDPNPPAASEEAELPVNANADPNASPLFGGRAKPEPVVAPTPTPMPTATPGPEATVPAPGPGESPAASPGGSPPAAPPGEKSGSHRRGQPHAVAFSDPQRREEGQKAAQAHARG